MRPMAKEDVPPVMQRASQPAGAGDVLQIMTNSPPYRHSVILGNLFRALWFSFIIATEQLPTSTENLKNDALEDRWKRVSYVHSNVEARKHSFLLYRESRLTERWLSKENLVLLNPLYVRDVRNVRFESGTIQAFQNMRSGLFTCGVNSFEKSVNLSPRFQFPH